MSFESTLPRVESSLIRLPDPPATLTVHARRWWGVLTYLALAGLLTAYLVGMFQDFQRVRDLRAEPSPLSKIVINKNEAWQRIYVRGPQMSGWQLSARAEARQNPIP